MNRIVLGFVLVMLMASCSSNSEGNAEKKAFKNLSYQEGLKVYQQRCAVCHGKKGEGLKNLYPPLANADYLLKNKEQIPCIIRNGLEGEIVVNGKTYNSKMISHSDLSALEIADLMTFLLNSWEMNEGNVSQSEVKSMLENCEK